MRTNCGLRTIITILETFEEVMEGAAGKVPAYSTIRDWVLRLGLSVYEDEKPKDWKYIAIQDESIWVNRQKLLLTLGIPYEHKGRPVEHKDVVVLNMKVAEQHKREDVKTALEDAEDAVGSMPVFALSDGGHNLVAGAADAGVPHHLDISHTLGNCMKHVYGKDDEFMALTTKLGKVRLQYHLTDKAWLLPPNMRAIARFMNLTGWVEWAVRLLNAFDGLEQEFKDAYAFLPDYRDLISELKVCTDAIRHVEEICKMQGLSMRSSALCQHYIIRHVIGNANSRRARLGLEMLDYFRKETRLLEDIKAVHHISSDIIESDFGIYKAKESPNKLYGITPLVLILPLYPKSTDYSVAYKQDFKVRLAKVKLKDVEVWAKDHLLPNSVSLRSKTLKKAS